MESGGVEDGKVIKGGEVMKLHSFSLNSQRI